MERRESRPRQPLEAYQYVIDKLSSSTAAAEAAAAAAAAAERKGDGTAESAAGTVIDSITALCGILAGDCKRSSAISAIQIAALLRERSGTLGDEKSRGIARVVIASSVEAGIDQLDEESELCPVHNNGLLVAAAAGLKLSLNKERVYIEEENVYFRLASFSLKSSRPLYVVRKSLTLIARLLKSSDIMRWKPGSFRAIRRSFEWLVQSAFSSISEQGPGEIVGESDGGDCSALAFSPYASSESPSSLCKEIECIAVVLWLRVAAIARDHATETMEADAVEEIASFQSSLEGFTSKLGPDYLHKIVSFVGKHGSDSLLWESASLLHKQLGEREPHSRTALLSSLIEQCVFDAQVIVDMLLESSTAEYVIRYFFLLSAAPLENRDENAAPVLQDLIQRLERAQRLSLFPYNVSSLIARLERIVHS